MELGWLSSRKHNTNNNSLVWGLNQAKVNSDRLYSMQHRLDTLLRARRRMLLGRAVAGWREGGDQELSSIRRPLNLSTSSNNNLTTTQIFSHMIQVILMQALVAPETRFAHHLPLLDTLRDPHLRHSPPARCLLCKRNSSEDRIRRYARFPGHL
jgi:hypothetical protein